MTAAVIFNLAVVAGVVLMAVLAVVPFLIQADLERPLVEGPTDLESYPVPTQLFADLPGVAAADRLAA